MKLSQLRDVLAVSETGSLRAAGRHLGIAQPAITRSIRDIEQELGATLFERHAAAPICIVRRPDMPLTPMAEYLCDMMRRVGGHYAHRLEAALV